MSDPLTTPAPAVHAPAPSPEDDAAWAEVLARWDDPAAHAGYLARCTSLESLARAGGHYREVLKTRPDDAVARKQREDIVKRATIVGLAALPRTVPQEKPAWFRHLIRAAAVGFGSMAAWAVYKLAVALLGGPQP
ncbi:MAG: hypothetical protein QM767_21010 [Anaeromyxobacter sp.]